MTNKVELLLRKNAIEKRTVMRFNDVAKIFKCLGLNPHKITADGSKEGDTSDIKFGVDLLYGELSISFRKMGASNDIYNAHEDPVINISLGNNGKFTQIIRSSRNYMGVQVYVSNAKSLGAKIIKAQYIKLGELINHIVNEHPIQQEIRAWIHAFSSPDYNHDTFKFTSEHICQNSTDGSSYVLLPSSEFKDFIIAEYKV